jgi:nitrogen regulatory protein A
MNGEEDLLLQELNRLRSEIQIDCCVLGLLDGKEGALKWRLAAGNLNERYRNMSDRPGRGITGTVVKVGRPMSLHIPELIMSRHLHEYPILLSEKLRSAYVVPIWKDLELLGVLLAGDRKRRIYRAEERDSMIKSCERISQILLQRGIESPSA